MLLCNEDVKISYSRRVVPLPRQRVSCKGYVKISHSCPVVQMLRQTSFWNQDIKISYFRQVVPLPRQSFVPWIRKKLLFLPGHLNAQVTEMFFYMPMNELDIEVSCVNMFQEY